MRNGVVGLSLAAFVGSVGLSGGAYELPASGEIVILVAWLLFVGSIMGVVPDARPRGARAIAAACLLALAVWSLISIGWSEAAGRSVAVAVQYTAVLSAVLLGTLILRRSDRDAALGGLLAGVVLVACFAVASRFHPGIAPKPSSLVDSSRMQSRLHWPIGYWNTLGFLAAIAVPLALNFAADAKTALARAASAASLPLLALCVLFTLSRGSILISAFGVITLVVLGPLTVRRLGLFAVFAAGCAFVVATALSKSALMDGVTASGAGVSEASETQTTLLLVAVVLAAAGAAAGYLPAVLSGSGRAPRFWLRFAVCGAALVAAGVTFLAAGGGSRLEHSWDAFRAPKVNLSQGRENSVDRLAVEGSNGRWQLWQGAVNEGNSKPINGTGAGTYELWWSQHATQRLNVRNAHSQYLEVYAELGLVGLLLMIGFVAALLVGCASALRSAGKELGSAAAGTASVLAFLLSNAFDWGWQVMLIPFVGMLAFAATAAEDRPEEQGREAPAALRGAVGTLAVLMLALAIPPVVSTGSLTQSQRDVQKGRVAAALGQANAAVDWQPYSAAAWLQRGLVYDSLGQSAKARESVKGAIEREPNGWRNWFALAGVEARAGNVKASLAAYRKARDLNPTSPLFAAGN